MPSTERVEVSSPTPWRCVAHLLLFVLFLGLGATTLEAQAARAGVEDRLSAETFSGFVLRGIGPALTSGRISDLAIHPKDRHTWYVAVGSGGVWKTTNAGTTFESIFDGQGSYSIGCVTLDPNDPNVVWVGSGENVSGRHVGFGDGVYRSLDGGKTWQHMGLRASEHVSRILVDPRDSNVVYVAAEGPLWSTGGDRGVYKSTDGGATWKQVLSIDADTGVASLELDPRDPDVLYAAAFQRRRTVWSYLAGGPGSGIHKSTDGAATWRKLTNGLPKKDMGKIGLAVSPIDPDVVYATIEAHPDEQGFYRSADRGESWEKGSDYVSGGTGPHYYQEIYASPHRLDRVYQMDVFLNATDDGGKTFYQVGDADKHTDNHAMAFVAADPDYLMVGSDGGLYESFDAGKTWKFVTNLPVTQVYKVALTEGFPVYDVIGGTQDNGTIVGPTRTLNRHGIRNEDWFFAFGADGYATAADPQEPNLLYVSWQTGHPLRYDRRTGELVEIQPQPEPGDPPERFNWDAPILVSPHDPKRIYYGSQRLWRSDDRGDSWRAVSADLTRGVLRYDLPVGGRLRGSDALWGNSAMSWYATTTAIAESPLHEGLLYVGTDDGVIQVSEDGGASWRRAELRGVPERAFVNELTASPVDADTVFASIDNHKEGDYAPYLLRSTDRGRTWQSIRGDLPDRHLVWSLQQDHERGDLLFVGTELGIFFTLDGGRKWIRLTGDAPTIAFRDLEIQRRESDLVGGSFGRGFWVLDDYSPLRAVTPEVLAAEAKLFPVRRAFWYVPEMLLQSRDKGSSGTDAFAAPNPPHGAVFTYWLRDELLTPKKVREQREKPLQEAGKDVPFAGFDALREEDLAPAPRMLLTVRDASGEVVRRLEGPTTKGFHRVSWDLRYAPVDPILLRPPANLPPWVEPPQGPLAPPGRYTVGLARASGGEVVAIGARESFEVVEVLEPSLEGADATARTEFARSTADLYRRASGAMAELRRATERLDYLERAVLATPGADPAALAEVNRVRRALADVRNALAGDPIRGRYQEPAELSVLDRLGIVSGADWNSRYGPTATHRRAVEIAEQEYAGVAERLRRVIEEELRALEEALEDAGAPWTPGRSVVPP
ncbi:MAG TPA: glycosyl hydrolase [Thermoanaerobaculia bacterium]|nr:glycosyl hydrolase [Thermoanaerobaculia bacterium]